MARHHGPEGTGRYVDGILAEGGDADRHSYVTPGDDVKTVSMTPSLRLRTLGSLNLIYTYKVWMLYELGPVTPSFDAVGSEDFGNQSRPMNSNLENLFDPNKPGSEERDARQFQYSAPGLTANGISRRMVDTPFFDRIPGLAKESAVAAAPRGRIATPADVVGETESFLSDAAHFVTGIEVPASGGVKF
jgi:hypothetical protein